jgi:hypothetical protein
MRRRKKNPSGWAIAGWVLLGLIVVPPILIGIAGTSAIREQEERSRRLREEFNNRL